MNTTLTARPISARFMSALHPNDPDQTIDRHGEGVKAMSLFESRTGRKTRAWDELSEIDRAVLLESVRQRRKVQAQKQKIYTDLYGLRSNR